MSAQPRIIGASIKRKEDARFITGRGQFTDDVLLPNQSYACFVRSPHAHARTKSIDATAARASPGVLAVYTGDDVAKDKIDPLPCGWLIHDVSGAPMKEPPHPILARGKVRHAGDQVAIVVAATQEQARDAAERVAVDYEDLPAVVSLRRALDADAPLVHDDQGLTANKCYTWALGDKRAVDAAFASAAHVVHARPREQSADPNAIEPRAANAQYNPAEDSYTLYVGESEPASGTSVDFRVRGGIPEHKLRVIAPDVGGGFGSKMFIYPEDVAVTWAARKCGRPVEWTAERSESFLVDAHGRDHLTHAELALDADGKFLAMRVQKNANMGAYLSTFGSCIPTILYGTLLAGQYRTPHIIARSTAVFTNTAPVDAYRGAGRPEATYVVERLVTRAAWQLGLAQDEIRRRNFVTEFPVPDTRRAAVRHWRLPAVLEQCERARRRSRLPGAQGGVGRARAAARPGLLELHRGVRARAVERGRRARRARGTFRGRRGARPSDRVGDRIHRLAQPRPGARDHVRAGRGRSSWHRCRRRRRRAWRSGRVLFGMGTYGSRRFRSAAARSRKRSTRSSRRRRRSRRICSKPAKPTSSSRTAASRSKAQTGASLRRRRARRVRAAQLSARQARAGAQRNGVPPIRRNSRFRPARISAKSRSTSIPESCDVDRFTAVDDFGKIINPMIVEGQVHGGVHKASARRC